MEPRLDPSLEALMEALDPTTATAARDAAAAELEKAQLKLGKVRGEFASTERSLEQLGDALAGGDRAAAKALTAAATLRETQQQVVAAHQRKVEQAEAELAAAEAALQQARQAERERQEAASREAFLDRARKADAAAVAMADALEGLRAAAATMERVRGPGRFSTAWDAITVKHRLATRAGRLAGWLAEHDKAAWAEMGAAIADPMWIGELARQAVDAAYDADLSPKPDPEPAPPPPVPERRPSEVRLPPPERPERAIGASTMSFS
jgi:multidrug efflux pump subunit AcrA (membrane-fusion protein)